MSFWSIILEKDKITDNIGKELKRLKILKILKILNELKKTKTLKGLKKRANTYTEEQKQLQVCLKKIYGDMSNYSVEDIIKRKAYLESKLDSENSIFANAGMAIITWFLLESGKQFCFAATTDDYRFANLFLVIIPPFLAVIPMKGIAIYMGKTDTKYRKYNLIDFELRIINEILEKEYNYNGIVEDILISRCRSSRDETEI